MTKRITLKHIAQETGLSVSSVSLALKGDSRFPKATLDKVDGAARKLGYIYNQGAADLRTSRSNTVAVCLGDISNPIFNDMLASAEREIDSRGKRLLLGVTRESRERQADFLHQAMRVGCEAILICPAYGTTCRDLEDILIRCGRLIVPTALFFRSIEGFAAPQVVSNEFEAGRLSARAAVEAGHRRIFWLGGGQETSAARLRQSGALAELRAAGIEVAGVFNGPTSRAFGFDITTKLLREETPEDLAFLCFSDLIALGVLSGCHNAGWQVGRDISVIGCDDMQEVRYSVPPLTTVRIDLGRIIEKAFEAASESSKAEVTLFEPELVTRSSLKNYLTTSK
ncbi:LacI family DNA-binding transcriptional regulator [Falsirhodobacter deserti]|uniref:LacI family DNA-binding transcriptional regulator n=1 Tax=Falsirhodobacter deserti TaxID=1365611 RepID=UPI000FE39620|nr:LacI family DNA-binding transcriptional regulator [Falsirhodobacter deserti]